MKDYCKLRPFDLEAARDHGEFLTCPSNFFSGNPVWKYATGPDSEGKIVVTVLDDGRFANPTRTSAFRMAPLAWVRKSADDDTLWPVYKGDVLYYAEQGYGMAVEGYNPHVQGESGALGEIVWRLDACAFKIGIKAWAPWDSYTFTPPKVKREGWINIYSQKSGDGIIYASKREAEEAALGSNAVQLRIEWEE